MSGSKVHFDETDDKESALLKGLLAQLEEDSKSAMSEELLLKYRKELNPYGRTIQGSDQILCFSYTDLREQYLSRFLMTSLIGFLNRACDEYKVPDGIVPVPVEDWLNDQSLTDTPAGVAGDALEDYEFNRRMMYKRCVIKEFIGSLFQFNPDEHVRSAYRPNPSDPERELVKTPAGRQSLMHYRRHDARIRKALAQREIDEEVAQIKGVKEEKKTAKEYDRVTTMIPPADIFEKWNYYREVNMEELRRATTDLYCDRLDFDAAINPYCVVNSKEEATAFMEKHRDEVISKICTAKTGAWTFFGNFKSVRDKIAFSNKDTEILDEIIRQREADAKTAAGMVAKKVEKRKAKNVARDGPDAANFAKWKAQNSIVRQMKPLNPSNTVSEECPDDAVQVDTFTMDHRSGMFTRDKFFMEAAAPVLPENGSSSSGSSSSSSGASSAAASSSGQKA